MTTEYDGHRITYRYQLAHSYVQALHEDAAFWTGASLSCWHYLNMMNLIRENAALRPT
jgi:hypothetical protein